MDFFKKFVRQVFLRSFLGLYITFFNCIIVILCVKFPLIRCYTWPVQKKDKKSSSSSSTSSAAGGVTNKYEELVHGPRAKKHYVIPADKFALLADNLLAPASHSETGFSDFLHVLMAQTINMELEPLAELAKSLAELVQHRNIAAPFLGAATQWLYRHVAEPKLRNMDQTTFFMTKFFTPWSRIVCTPWLINSLGTFIMQTIGKTNLPLEIDANKLDDPSSVESNEKNIMELVTQLHQTIQNSCPSLPGVLKMALSNIRQALIDRGISEEAASSFCLRLFHFRFVAPALLGPHVYGVTNDPPPPDMLRNLILIVSLYGDTIKGDKTATKSALRLSESNATVWKEKTSSWGKDYFDSILPYGEKVSLDSGAPICGTSDIVCLNALGGVLVVLHQIKNKLRDKATEVLSENPAGQANALHALETILEAYPTPPAEKK